MSDIEAIIVLPKGLLENSDNIIEGYFNARLLQTRDKLIRDLIKLEREDDENAKNNVFLGTSRSKYWEMRQNKRNNILFDLMSILLVIEGRFKRRLTIALDLCDKKDL